ncbi:F-box/FBD/LRR-repeat protein-like protein [Tanacetum coccineum]
MNRISDLPPGIIESILCFLPIKEVVKTSILSREWRYRWMKIPKLVFKEFKFHVRTDKAELTDVADGTESSDEAESSDGTESSDGFESSDGAESSDGTESCDGDESSDGSESSDGLQSFGQPNEKKSERLTERRKFFYAICQVLLMHEGPLHEFSVSMFPDELCFIDDECVEMDAIIFHLSRKNNVKKLTIEDMILFCYPSLSSHYVT